jgi:soluble lytic murein transglycosylase
MRRAHLLLLGLAVFAALAGGAVWIAKRTVRWNDARTMPPPLEAAVRAYARGDDASGLAHVRTLLARYRAPAWESRARVLAASHLAARGKDGEIGSVLPRELPQDDPLAPLALALRARNALARSDPARAADLARRVLAVPSYPMADDARTVLVEAMVASGGWQDAIRLLDTVHLAAAAEAAARIAVAHHDVAGARRRLLDAVLAPRSSEDTASLLAAIDEALPDAAARLPEAERPRVAPAARRLLEDGRAQQALDVLALVRPAGAPSSATPEESLVEAEALFKLGRTAEARGPLARAMLGDASTKDGARYLEARMAAEGGRFDAYRLALASLSRQGASPWRERALLDLAKSVEGVPNVATLDAYRRYRVAAGASADPLALLREAWAAYELGKIADAESGFTRALARPDAPGGVRVTALYWRGRIADAAGHATQARELFRQVVAEFGNHYYGMLAARRLGASPPAAAPDPPPLANPQRLGAAGRWLVAGRQLASVGLWDNASAFYGAALEGAGDDRMTVASEAAAAARQAASLTDAVSFAQRAVGDRDHVRPETVPRSLWRLLTPAPSADAITHAARENGFDPPLVAAVALQESAFNPLAVSAAGARGLLQVMPAVGVELAGRMKLPHFDVNDLFDPEVNLRLGCAHLKEYVGRFGSLPAGLAAYNGGPSRVERWTAHGPRDDERFVERIPIPETRIYVKRVLAGARLYAISWPHGLGAE